MKCNKLLSLLLVLFMVINLFSGVVYADGILTENSTALNELSVRNAIFAYYQDRENLLAGASSADIDTANEAMVDDEQKHRELLAQKNISFVDSQVSIGEISCGDAYAVATVTEVVTYCLNYTNYTETINHRLMLFLNDEGVPFVTSDEYIETYSSFYSCSYVFPEPEISVANTGVGGRPCIAVVAQGEVGYTESSSGYTKYGQWCGYPYEPWCAMFVAWCGNKANISQNVIPKYINVTSFVNNLPYYSRSNTTPQVGDLAIFTNNDHIGIVVAVGSSSYTLVDGNNVSVNGVASNSFSFTSSSIIGYCRPNYTATSHHMDWNSNENYHWGTCDGCGYTASQSAHIYIGDTCKICGYPDIFIGINKSSSSTN